MGIPIYLAVPEEQNELFGGLCVAPFGKGTFEQFLSFVDAEAERHDRLGRRVIGVPMDIEDFAAWLDGREATQYLWLAYAAERAATVRHWPPRTSRFFSSTGGRL
jgi:hypothetical protein